MNQPSDSSVSLSSAGTFSEAAEPTSVTGATPHALPDASPAAAADVAHAGHAPASSARQTSDAAAAEPGAPTAVADSDDGGDEAEAGSEVTTGGGGTEASGEDGGALKRKRRRRRKKKSGEGIDGATEATASGDAPAGADGVVAPGGGGQRQRPQHAKKDRPERERPAFNVGDVVFGKVLQVTEDCLFADLSGKATAIFDLRELLITEEEAEEYNRAHKADRKAAQAEPSDTPETDAAPADVASTLAEHVVAEGESATADVVGATVSAEADGEAAPVEPTVAKSESDEATAAVPPAAESAVALDEKGPQLPRVILEPGAPFVGLVHNDGGRGGLVVLTHHPKRVSKTKPMVGEASRSGALVFGLVTGTIKGGVEVDIDGLRAFAPASHVELRPGADLSALVGKRLAFAVTQYTKRGRDVVVSRRSLLEAEAKIKREEALKNIKFGEVVDGIVRTVVPFGAFIDIGGIEGLVPLSEMSHNRADGPRDVFAINDTVRVKIQRVDERGKLWLSRRAAIEDPWAAVAQKYAQGTRHTGKVVRLQPFGAFVELEPGIDGLIHSIDLSIKRIEHAEEVVKLGDELELVVASVDSSQHRIALHPAPTGDAANEEVQRVQLGKMLKVVVVLAETGGLTVRVRGATGRHARGFITASATGTARGTELRKLFPVGKELEAKVVEMDPRRGEIKLSIKALAEETERNAYQQYRAQVKREAKFGTLADLLQKRNITPSK